MSVETKTGYHHGNLRAQLVEAVRVLLEQKGPEGFSVSEASRLAGVSTAAPYKHFKDKPDIMRAVAMEGMCRLRSAMLESLERQSHRSLDRIIAIGRAYIGFARKEPGVFRMMFGQQDRDGVEADMQAAGEAAFDVLISEVATYMNRELDDLDVRRNAYLLWTFVHGHAFLEIDQTMAPDGHKPDETYLLETITRRVLLVS
ncbi:TetR/AcrR family transcriptional regulator [Halomonas sp. PR-M31]|uniref:TetR/AcrR family transcriptional regulator n=1 Tax=Halomonas sp. PR-M31 TaxID=1471202 RepID=UPI0006508821|nr:TetR/AcrR family transcriptional regulator [Halomonas sp. PR-M31]